MTSGLPLLKEVIINSVDVSSFVKVYFVKPVVKYSNVNLKQAEIFLTANVVDSLNLKDKSMFGKSVTIKRGISSATENFLFEGYIKDDISFQGGLIKVTAKDILFKADDARVNTSFDKDIDTYAGVGSDLFETLITDHTSLSTDSSVIVSTGSTILIDKLVCIDAKVLERINRVAYIYNYQVYRDPGDGYVTFEPKGYTNISDVFTVGDNIINVPEWKNDFTGKFNKLKLTAGDVLTSATQAFDGTGSQDTFTLSNQPESVKVSVGGTEQTGGQPGATSSFDYTVDKVNNQIVFESGSIPGAGSGNVVVEYFYLSPIIVEAQNETSIALYSGGVAVEEKISRPEIKTESDAEDLVDQLLSVNSVPDLKCNQLRIRNVSDLKSGVTANFVDPGHTIDEDLIIERIEYRYPYDYDRISVSENPLTDIPLSVIHADRLKRLEDEKSKNQDIVISIKKPSHTFTLKRRESIRQKWDITGNTTLIFGNVTYGVWNSYNWNSAVSAGSYSEVYRAPGNNLFEEYIYDSDYVDAGNTTATVDTSNNQIDFTDGEIFTSDRIALGPLYTYVTLNIGAETGSLTYEISSNNKSTWQTITKNVRTALSSSDGTGIYLRATSSGVSQIASVTDTEGNFTSPGIKLTFE